MAKTNVVTLDLNFQNNPHAIAVYVVRHAGGAVLVESGPGSTIGALKAGLASQGLKPHDVTHVLLTHIHLDHAGAAGWLAAQGAQVYVHPIGAPHLANPEKLLRSAQRIYGDKMEELWGEMLPVPNSRLTIPRDGEEIRIGPLGFVAIDTPGHAEHHYAYVFEDICFSGDIGGIRVPGPNYLRIPMPPPELHLEKWRTSLARLRGLEIARIAPTHFGIFSDPDWQLGEVERRIDETARWLEAVMALDPGVEDLRRRFLEWMNSDISQADLDPDSVRAYELANPPGMSADGLFRYWHKVHAAAQM